MATPDKALAEGGSQDVDAVPATIVASSSIAASSTGVIFTNGGLPINSSFDEGNRGNPTTHPSNPQASLDSHTVIHALQVPVWSPRLLIMVFRRMWARRTSLHGQIIEGIIQSTSFGVINLICYASCDISCCALNHYQWLWSGIPVGSACGSAIVLQHRA